MKQQKLLTLTLCLSILSFTTFAQKNKITIKKSYGTIYDAADGGIMLLNAFSTQNQNENVRQKIRSYAVNLSYSRSIGKNIEASLLFGIDYYKRVTKYTDRPDVYIKYENQVLFASELNFYYTKKKDSKVWIYGSLGVGSTNMYPDAPLKYQFNSGVNKLVIDVSLLNACFRLNKHLNIEVGSSLGYKGLLNIGLSSNF